MDVAAERGGLLGCKAWLRLEIEAEVVTVTETKIKTGTIVALKSIGERE
jgi:hypothetical protein